MSVFDRLFSRAIIRKNGCWEWSGCRNNKGYGQLRVDGHKEQAHRVAYDLVIGDIPEDMLVLHRCDNPCCVNPQHLFLGTYQDNVDDMIEKGRDAYGDCWGERNGQSKLTEDKVMQIRQLLNEDNRSAREIGELFNVSKGAIMDIKSGRRWRNV